jgi:signal transduction histidine kinase
MEQSTAETDFVHLMSNKLVQAKNPQQQLEAVSDYARLRGATQGVLFYIENPEIDPVEWVLVSAEWLTDDKHLLGVGERFDTLQLSFVSNVIFTFPIRPLLIEDVHNRTDVDAPLMEILIAHYVRGTAILPLHNNGRWIGLLWFTWDTPQTFTQQDAKIYTSILQQVAPIIDSYRLLEQRHQRTIELENAYQELDLLYHTGELINRANTYEELVKAVAPFDLRSDFVSLMLWETLDWETSDRLHVVFSLDRTGDGVLKTGDYVSKSDFPVMRLMLGNRLWDFDNTQTDSRTDEQTRASWKAINTLSFYGIALYVGNRWIGGITFHSNRPRRYSDRQKRLLVGIGDMVLGAVERIRLKHESETSMQTTAVLEERNRLARELHDSVSQALYGIVLSMKTAQVQMHKAPDQIKDSLDYALSLSQAALSEMRALIFELRPETLEKEGLIDALHRQTEMIQLRYGVKVISQMCDEPHLPLEVKEHIYWIAREALHNIVKHARASEIEVSLRYDAALLTLNIRDDGIGFDPERDFAGHLGLYSMSERASRLNAQLKLMSQPGNGTSLTLHVGQVPKSL